MKITCTNDRLAILDENDDIVITFNQGATVKNYGIGNELIIKESGCSIDGYEGFKLNINDVESFNDSSFSGTRAELKDLILGVFNTFINGNGGGNSTNTIVLNTETINGQDIGGLAMRVNNLAQVYMTEGTMTPGVFKVTFNTPTDYLNDGVRSILTVYVETNPSNGDVLEIDNYEMPLTYISFVDELNGGNDQIAIQGTLDATMQLVVDLLMSKRQGDIDYNSQYFEWNSSESTLLCYSNLENAAGWGLNHEPNYATPTGNWVGESSGTQLFYVGGTNGTPQLFQYNFNPYNITIYPNQWNNGNISGDIELEAQNFADYINLEFSDILVAEWTVDGEVIMTQTGEEVKPIGDFNISITSNNIDWEWVTEPVVIVGRNGEDYPLGKILSVDVESVTIQVTGVMDMLLYGDIDLNTDSPKLMGHDNGRVKKYNNDSSAWIVGYALKSGLDGETIPVLWQPN